MRLANKDDDDQIRRRCSATIIMIILTTRIGQMKMFAVCRFEKLRAGLKS
jgi:hypothetical protein